LITPLLQELADENTHASWFANLHKILGRIVGAIVKKILPGLTAANERFCFTVQGLKVGADGRTATAMLSCVQAQAWLAQQQAKMDAAMEARCVLEYLGMSMNATSAVAPQVVVYGGPDLRPVLCVVCDHLTCLPCTLRLRQQQDEDSVLQVPQ
jgi:hypothetical protein